MTPRPPLAALEDDALRLLHGGAALARDDASLEQSTHALDALAARVTALAPLAAQARRAREARSPADAARELLALAANAGRALRAQAHAGAAEGELVALEAPRVKPDFACPDARRDELWEVLTCQGHDREARLAALLREGDLTNDVRLLAAWIAGTDSPKLGYQAGAVLGGMPEALVVPALEAAYDPRGGLGDGMRLDALARLQGGERAEALLVHAVEHGSEPVAARAAQVLQAQYPAVYLRLAPSLASSGYQSNWQRVSAIGALRGASSPVAVATLLAALGDVDRWVADAAESSLRAAKPGALDVDLRAFLTKLAAKLASPTPDLERHAARALALFVAVATKLGGSDEPLLLGLLRGSTSGPVREHAAAALRRVGTQSALEAVASELGDPHAPLALHAVEAAIELGPAEAFARLSPLCAPPLLDAAGGVARAGAVMDALARSIQRSREAGGDASIDARWIEPCFAVVGRLEDRSAGREAARAVINGWCAARYASGARESLGALVALLGVDDEARWYAMPVLAKLGGAPVADRLIAAIGLVGTALRAKTAQKLRELPFDKAWFEARCVAVDRNCDKPIAQADRDAIRALCAGGA